MNRTLPHLAVFAANAIYALNYSVAKDVMPEYLTPKGFIVLRVVGATLLFVLIDLLSAKKTDEQCLSRIEKKDFLRIAICGLFGIAMNQIMFFEGLALTTPIEASIMMTTNPILVLIISAIVLKERLFTTKIIGILVGLSGALLAILGDFGGDLGVGGAIGNILIFLNALSYGIYLVLVKPLMQKYRPITLIKYVFLCGMIYVLPVGIWDLLDKDILAFPVKIQLEILFVVVFTTFFAYLLNIIGLKKLNASTVSIYIYSQPVLATFFAILLGADTLTATKIGSAVLVFVGVYLVGKKKKASV